MNPKALFNITYGLFMLSAQMDGRDNACIINTVAQIANEPTRIGIAAIQKNLTHDMILKTGRFNVSAISMDAPFELFKRFGMQSGRNVDKFDGFADAERSANGLYHLTKYANAWFSAKVVDKIDLGSHTYFVAELEDCEVLSSVPSCTYGYYQSDIKPKPAPVEKKGWVCSVCGYVYEGEDMPEDFICPLCKHGKKDFQRMDAAAPIAKPAAVEAPAAGAKKFVCSVCGYVHEGDSAPEFCPQCKVPAEKFMEQSGEMSWAAEHIVGVAQGAPEEIMEGLRANFTGECTEVGMYLAMARVAHREGLPMVGEYWEKAAREEAEHAAKFAELLGEVITDSTEKNLQMRVEAENGATAGKTELARLAKQLNLDAIHDTVHEMARDEARHGKALKGLLEKYFGK